MSRFSSLLLAVFCVGCTSAPAPAHAPADRALPFEKVFSPELRVQRLRGYDRTGCNAHDARDELKRLCREIRRQWFAAYEPIHVKSLREPLDWRICESEIDTVYLPDHVSQLGAECQILGLKAIKEFIAGGEKADAKAAQ